MSDEQGTKNEDEDTEGSRVLRQGDAGRDDTEGSRVLRMGDAGQDDTEGNRVLRQGDAGRDDVAGHLRMTDEQLESGTTPSEATQEQRQKK